MPEFDVKEKKPKSERPMPQWAKDMEPYVDWLDAKLGWRTWLIVGVPILALMAGTPHMLVTYSCYGDCRWQNVEEFDCRYFGIWGWREAEPDPQTRRCTRFRLL